MRIFLIFSFVAISAAMLMSNVSYSQNDIGKKSSEETSDFLSRRLAWFTSPRRYPSDRPNNTGALTLFEYETFRRAADQATLQGVEHEIGMGTGEWTSLGPTSYVTGSSGYSGGIGRVNVVVVDPTEPNKLYLGAASGGVWTSDDAGASWKPLSDGLPSIGVSDIAVDPANSSDIYLMTGDADGSFVPSIGLLKGERSADGAETWSGTGLTWKASDSNFGYRIVVVPKTATLLAATTVGLLRGSTNGTSWGTVENGSFFDIAIHPTDPSVIYAATGTTVYRCTDGKGASWTPLLHNGLPDPLSVPSNRIRLAVSPANPKTLYALYGSASGFDVGLYRSDDQGDHFTLQSNSPNILGSELDGTTGSDSQYDLSLAISPTNINEVYVGGANTWRSDDGGKKWYNTSYWRDIGQANYTHADIHDLVFWGSALYAATDGGIYRSSEGATWRSISAGLAISEIYRLCGASGPDPVLYFGGQDIGVNRIDPRQPMMIQVLGADGGNCQIDPRNPNVVYGTNQNGALYRSIDGANSFSQINPPDAGIGNWVTPFILDSTSPSKIAACYTDVWQSGDQGVSWQNLTNGRVGADHNCVSIAISASDSTKIYVAKSNTVFFSPDGGAGWVDITGSLPVDIAQITRLAVNPRDPSEAWVTFSGYQQDTKVYSTNDFGKSWNNKSNGLPNLPANVIIFATTSKNELFVGMDVGVYRFDPALGSWKSFSSGLPNVIISDLLFNSDQQILYAASFGRGLWSSEMGGEKIAAQGALVPPLAAKPYSYGIKVTVAPYQGSIEGLK
jgi:hypothetical protein